MKNWKKTWQDELDNITPELSEEVKNAPIHTQRQAVASYGDVAVKNRYNQRNLIVIVTAVILCLVIVGAIITLNVTPRNGLYTVEINPAVSFVTDRHGKVTRVIASNADADVILSSQEAQSNMLGNSIDKAIEYYVDCAARLGYIDMDNAGSAVRVSACSGKKTDVTLQNISASLQAYFTSRGVFAVVVAEQVNTEEYCLRSGINKADSVANIVKTVKSSDIMYSNRNVQGMTVEQMKDSYENVVGNYLGVDFVRDIRDNWEVIRQSERDINNLYELNEQIEEHEDNTGIIIWKDYWSVKDKATGDSFAALLSQMEAALTDYETKYGVIIGSKTELDIAKNYYEALPMEQLENLLDSLTDSLLRIWSDSLTAVMEISGIIDRNVAALSKLPETIAEYAEKTAEVFKSAYESRVNEYRAVYDKVRAEISASEYQSYIDGIIAKYGSLEQYWNETKK